MPKRLLADDPADRVKESERAALQLAISSHPTSSTGKERRSWDYGPSCGPFLSALVYSASVIAARFSRARRSIPSPVGVPGTSYSILPGRSAGTPYSTPQGGVGVSWKPKRAVRLPADVAALNGTRESWKEGLRA